MEKLIIDLIERQASPKSIAFAIVLFMKNGSYESRKIASEYTSMWNKIINNEDVMAELWKFEIICKADPLEKATLMEKYINISKVELMEMADELWQAYPAVLPLSGGGSFLARKGTDKEEILKMYLARIKNSPEKHQWVLEQLQVYIKLVVSQKINGHRIQEWVSNEIWDTIPAISGGTESSFKTDI